MCDLLKTHPPGPMLIATKSCPDVIRTRVIELWGGVNAPWSPWLLQGQGEYAFAGSGLAGSVSGGRALAVSFGICGYRNSSRVQPLQSRVT